MENKPSNDGWRWWAGDNEEVFRVGPCATRREAIDAATDERMGEFQDDEDGGAWKLGIHLVEARNDPLRLADWIGVKDIVERAEESLADSDRIGCDGDEGPWFEATPEQNADLYTRLKSACDDWQAAHGLNFTCITFSAMRNEEYVVVAHPNGPHNAAPAQPTEWMPVEETSND